LEEQAEVEVGEWDVPFAQGRAFVAQCAY